MRISLFTLNKAGGGHPMQMAATESNTIKNTHNYGKKQYCNGH